MQQILNALFIILIWAANQQKPIHYSVRKYGDTYIEFHSWYVLKLEEWYVTITDGERKTKVRARLAVDGKMSPEFMKVLKDLLNKDFNSWIKIENESSTNNVDAKVDEDDVEWDVEWTNTNDLTAEEKTTGDVNDNSEATTWLDEEKKAPQRKIPWRAESEKKKK